MSSTGKTKKVTPTAMEAQEDEVEELLKAAQDEISLKLTINSHMSRVAPSYLDSDLNTRFQSLKKTSLKPLTTNPKSTTTQSTATTAATEDRNSKDDHDDLLARFAALKGSLNLPSSSSVLPEKKPDRSDRLSKDADEVERIVQWAIDAARLGPSSFTDDEAEINGTDDDEEDSDDDEEDSDDDDYKLKRKKKGNKK